MNTRSFRTVTAMILSVALLMGNIPVFVAAATNGEDLPESTVSVDYYGRAALAELDNSEALLYAYDQIAAGVESAQEQITVYNNVDSLYEADLLVAWDAYCRDHTEHFWLHGEFSYSHYADGRIVYMRPKYLMTGDDLTEAKATFLQAADAVLSGITDAMSEYEKELYLHDKLAQIATYTEATNAHNAYGALVEGETVCEGYAEALQYLLHRAGIQSFQVHGYGVNKDGAAELHAWNLVRIDGEYYYTDLTWDDQGDTIYHAYFNQTDAVMEEDHIITEAAYPLPECTATEAQYFTGKDEKLDTYSVESVGALLRDNDLRVQVYIPGDIDAFWQWYVANISAIGQKAGITEGFQYGNVSLGREMVLYIGGLSVSVSTGDERYYYSTIDRAMKNCATGSKLKLLADVEGDLSFSQDAVIDLNGFSIDGDVATAAGTVVYVKDSQTDDYTIADSKGYGRITGTVSGVQPQAAYVTITEDDGSSFHRISVTVEKVNLRAETAGIYYTANYKYDEVVARNVDTRGVALSTENAEPVADDSDESSLYTATLSSNNSALLDNIMELGNINDNGVCAREKVHSRAYLKLKNSAYVYSSSVSVSLKTLVETIDASAWSVLTANQKESLVEMYKTFSTVMNSWKIHNIKSAAI